MTDDDHENEESGEYDPRSPTPPAREPPLRTTAPQGRFTNAQVGIGFVVLIVGLVLVFGLPLALA